MEQKHSAGARLISSILLAAAILIGCGMLANSFANNYYSSGGAASYVPDDIIARVDSFDSGYLSEWKAVAYIALEWEVWMTLIDSGDLNGTFITFEPPDGVKEGVIRVFSKAKLDDWMQAKFTQQAE